jgi:hypothetical protein
MFVGALLVALAPAWPDRAAGREEPKRPPPWGDRWEPPRPPETPEPGAPVDAATFAADCNDDGMVRVDADLAVRGGSGTLSVDCHVEVADAATLTLIDVTLAGPYAIDLQCGAGGRLMLANSYLTLFTRIGVSGHGGAALAIRDSELSSMAGGAIEIVLTGTGAAIELLDSMIMSDGAMLIDVSPRSDGGRIGVRNATLAAGSVAASDLSLAASLDGLAGEAVVLESQLIGGALIAIETGAQGRTEVRDNIIETPGEVRIAAGDGGHCESTGNDPAQACPQLVEGGATAVATTVSGK